MLDGRRGASQKLILSEDVRRARIISSSERTLQEFAAGEAEIDASGPSGLAFLCYQTSSDKACVGVIRAR